MSEENIVSAVKVTFKNVNYTENITKEITKVDELKDNKEIQFDNLNKILMIEIGNNERKQLEKYFIDSLFRPFLKLFTVFDSNPSISALFQFLTIVPFKFDFYTAATIPNPKEIKTNSINEYNFGYNSEPIIETEAKFNPRTEETYIKFDIILPHYLFEKFLLDDPISYIRQFFKEYGIVFLVFYFGELFTIQNHIYENKETYGNLLDGIFNDPDKKDNYMLESLKNIDYEVNKKALKEIIFKTLRLISRTYIWDLLKTNAFNSDSNDEKKRIYNSLLEIKGVIDANFFNFPDYVISDPEKLITYIISRINEFKNNEDFKNYLENNDLIESYFHLMINPVGKGNSSGNNSNNNRKPNSDDNEENSSFGNSNNENDEEQKQEESVGSGSTSLENLPRDKLEEIANNLAVKYRGTGLTEILESIGINLNINKSWVDKIVEIINNEGFFKGKKEEVRWNLPNIFTRHVTYLPSRRKIGELPKFIIAYDSSASVSNDDLEKMNGMIQYLIEKGYTTRILTHTDGIHSDNTFNRKNFDEFKEFAKFRKVYGGTSHKDVFMKIDEELDTVKKCKNSIILIISDFYSDLNQIKQSDYKFLNFSKIIALDVESNINSSKFNNIPYLTYKINIDDNAK